MGVQSAWARMALFGWGGRVVRDIQQGAPFLELLTPQEPLFIQATNSLGRSSFSLTSLPSAVSHILSSCTGTAHQCGPGSMGAKKDGSDGCLVSKERSSPMLAMNNLSRVFWGFTRKRSSKLGGISQSCSFQCTAHAEEACFKRGYATASFNPASQRARQHSAASISSPDPADSAARTRSELAASAPSKTKADGTLGARWYKHVGVERIGDSAFHVTLDGKRLPSPAKRPLVLPTKELALAIAAEWEWQDQKSIRPFTMPLMKLASTATDLVPLQRNAIVENLMKYFRTSDAVCVREPRGGELQRKQGEIWDPLLDWMERELGVRPVTSRSIFGAEQPHEVVRIAQEVLHQKSDFRLAAVDALASSAHSLVIALAVSRGHLGPRKALEAVRVEEDHQMEEWGLVEGGHDLDIADTKVRIAAPSLFLRLLNE